MQITYGGKKGELVLTDIGVFFVSEQGIKKVSAKGIDNSDKKELEESLKKTKDFMHLKCGNDVLSALKKEIGDFELVF